ncbi:hypothetical protein PLESTM_000526200 [Pleodorina starrii]|nr:hypothetical protein PLESTM_000526200 [Pleodorina starrii]
MRVLYLLENIVSNNDVLQRFIRESSLSPTITAAQRDRERRVQVRQAKWAANAGRLIEFFSSLGVLSESFQDNLLDPNLARMGYQAGPVYIGDDDGPPVVTKRYLGVYPQYAQPAAAVPRVPAVPVPDWMHAADWKLPRGLSLTPLQPVTSCRLVTDITERDWVLAEAERTSGLKMFGGGGDVTAPSLPVPTASVATVADVRWLSWPGRYAVSRKCDGTRHLMLAVGGPLPPPLQPQPGLASNNAGGGSSSDDSGGSSGDSGSGDANTAVIYLLNRAGALYAFPVHTSGCSPLPAGTVLDGELVWLGGRGFFLAFDALCLGGERLWRLPLRQRLAALEEGGLGLTEAEASHELQAAAVMAVAAEAATLAEAAKAAAVSKAAEAAEAAEEAETAKTAEAAAAAAAAGMTSWGSRASRSKAAEAVEAAKTAKEVKAAKAAAAALAAKAAAAAKMAVKIEAAKAAKAAAAARRAGVAPARAAVAVPSAAPAPSPDMLHKIWKKQQAPPPGSDVVLLLRKRHTPVSYQTLQGLHGTLSDCPYPTDGLVFTPYDMPYVMGMAELLYKWQSAETIAVDVAGRDVDSLPGTWVPRIAWDRNTLIKELVYECLPNRGPRDTVAGRLAPVSVRWDKVQGNPRAAWQALEAVMNGPLSHANFLLAASPTSAGPYGLLAAFRIEGPLAAAEAAGLERWTGASCEGGEEVAAAAAGGAESGGTAAATRAQLPGPRALHLARVMPYDELYGQVMAAVQAGSVERSVDVGTRLEVFNYRPSAPPGPVEALCRGLVLHPPSASVVATPFVKFGEVAPEANHLKPPVGRRPGLCTVRHRAPPQSRRPGLCTVTDGEVEDELLAQVVLEEQNDTGARRDLAVAGDGGGGCLATASVKVDGSLILAFVWGGSAADGDPAVWAGDWLRTHAHVSAFRPGWTYMLEAVYDTNTVVVPYTFEGLVLLGAVDPRGAELPLSELPALAADLGVTMAVPYITGTLNELLVQLPGSRSRDQHVLLSPVYGAALPPPPPPGFEGWVVAAAGGPRQKLVQLPYKRASLAAALPHPLAVWDRVRTGGASRNALAASLPRHLRNDLFAILEALGVRYHEARGELLQLLRRRRQEQQALEQQHQQQREQHKSMAPAAPAAPAAAVPAKGVRYVIRICTLF